MTGHVHRGLHGLIVTYDRPAELVEFLRRLRLQTRGLDSLVVVDNLPSEASRDAVSDLQSIAPVAEYLPMSENLGPAGGIARGMQRVLGYASPDDWIVLFDDDDPPDRVDLLADLVTSLSVAIERRPELSGFGTSGARFDIGRGRVVRLSDRELAGGIVDVDWIGGNQFPMYRIAAVQHVGPFAEELFFGFDDLEYGLRLRSAGLGLAVDASIMAMRREAAGRTGWTPTPHRALQETNWRRYYSLRNLIVLIRTYGSESAAAAFALKAGLGKPLMRVFVQPRLALAHLSLNIRAVRDAYMRRMGRAIEPTPKSQS